MAIETPQAEQREQRVLADRIRAIIEAAGAPYAETSLPDHGNGPARRWVIQEGHQGHPQVVVTLYGDSLEVAAGAASALFETQDAGQSWDRWFDFCSKRVDALLRHSLRLKIFDPSWLPNAKGAIWFETPDRRGWSGDLLAIWFGHEQVIPAWHPGLT